MRLLLLRTTVRYETCLVALIAVHELDFVDQQRGVCCLSRCDSTTGYLSISGGCPHDTKYA